MVSYYFLGGRPHVHGLLHRQGSRVGQQSRREEFAARSRRRRLSGQRKVSGVGRLKPSFT